MKKRFAALGLVGACAMCCAPLLLLVFAAAGLTGAGALGGGLLADVPLEAIICGAIPLAALAGFTVWTYRRRRAAQSTCDCQGACSTTSCGPGASSRPSE